MTFSVIKRAFSGGGETVRRRPSKSFAFSMLAGAILVGNVIFRSSQNFIPRDQTPARLATATSSFKATADFQTKDHNTLDLWLMSNLRDTPLRMTTASSSTSPSGPRQFIFPPETKTVWIDVGVNRATDFLPNLQADDSLFVLGFEPSHKWRPCTEHAHCAVFWAACTPDFDVVELNVQGAADLCDSLLKPNNNTKTKLYKPCVTQQTDKTTGKPQTVQVPGIPLHALVERLPDNINVEYIKIDAQGYDLEVMKGAMSSTTLPHDRIQVVSLETMDVTDPEKLLYFGQPMFHQVKEYMEQRGWIYVHSVSNNGAEGEVNAFFISNERYREKVDHLAKVLMSNKEGQGQK